MASSELTEQERRELGRIVNRARLQSSLASTTLRCATHADAHRARELFEKQGRAPFRLDALRVVCANRS